MHTYIHTHIHTYVHAHTCVCGKVPTWAPVGWGSRSGIYSCFRPWRHEQTIWERKEKAILSYRADLDKAVCPSLFCSVLVWSGHVIQTD